MNKLLIVLLAVCLVSVHGFVRREAPTETPALTLESIQKQFQDGANIVQEKLQSSFNPDEIKAGINKFVDEISKAMDNLKKGGQAQSA